jgi:hypothetical protein
MLRKHLWVLGVCVAVIFLSVVFAPNDVLAQSCSGSKTLTYNDCSDVSYPNCANSTHHSIQTVNCGTYFGEVGCGSAFDSTDCYNNNFSHVCSTISYSWQACCQTNDQGCGAYGCPSNTKRLCQDCGSGWTCQCVADASCGSAPPPGGGGSNPIGYHDYSNCTVSGGWTCDSDSYGTTLTVRFYTDSARTNYIGETIASQTREQAVADLCGGFAGHGFTFTTPESVKTGTNQTIYAYAINTGGGADVLLNTPATISCAPSSTPPPTTPPYSGYYFDLKGPGGFPGIPAYGGTTNLTQANVSETGWLANSLGSSTKIYNSTYFLNAIPEDMIINSLSSSIDGSAIASGGTATDGIYWYEYDPAANGGSDLTINTLASLGARKVVVIVKGADVYLNGEITLTKGSGFFLLVAGATTGGTKGNIIVSPTVGGGASANLEGIFVTDGAFQTGLASTQLWVRGTVASYGGISLQRDLGDLNSTTPAELFEFAPDLALLFPQKLGAHSISWQEVAP